MLALPVLAASTAYAVVETLGWREGLGRRGGDARGFYLVLVASVVAGAAIDFIPGFHVVHALFYSQVLDGVLLPLVVFVLLVLSNDRAVVSHARNPGWVNAVAVVTILATLAADFVALVGP